MRLAATAYPVNPSAQNPAGDRDKRRIAPLLMPRAVAHHTAMAWATSEQLRLARWDLRGARPLG
jgi:hypothetical protein